jgi:hypothetical protein
MQLLLVSMSNLGVEQVTRSINGKGSNFNPKSRLRYLLISLSCSFLSPHSLALSIRESVPVSTNMLLPLKNFGEVPSPAVTALSVVTSSLPTREINKNEFYNDHN